MDSKNILTSKTFWFNVLTAVATYAGYLPVPADILAVIVAVANLGLRFLTTEAVHLPGLS